MCFLLYVTDMNSKAIIIKNERQHLKHPKKTIIYILYFHNDVTPKCKWSSTSAVDGDY